MKILISTILVLVVYFSNLAFSQELLQRYTVNNGVLTGFGNDEPPKVTLMVDTKTGKTWMLGWWRTNPCGCRCLSMVPILPTSCHLQTTRWKRANSVSAQS
jgi:hypothetical protein